MSYARNSTRIVAQGDMLGGPGTVPSRSVGSKIPGPTGSSRQSSTGSARNLDESTHSNGERMVPASQLKQAKEFLKQARGVIQTERTRVTELQEEVEKRTAEVSRLQDMNTQQERAKGSVEAERDALKRSLLKSKEELADKTQEAIQRDSQSSETIASLRSELSAIRERRHGGISVELENGINGGENEQMIATWSVSPPVSPIGSVGSPERQLQKAFVRAGTAEERNRNLEAEVRRLKSTMEEMQQFSDKKEDALKIQTEQINYICGEMEDLHRRYKKREDKLMRKLAKREHHVQDLCNALVEVIRAFKETGNERSEALRRLQGEVDEVCRKARAESSERRQVRVHEVTDASKARKNSAGVVKPDYTISWVQNSDVAGTGCGKSIE